MGILPKGQAMTGLGNQIILGKISADATNWQAVKLLQEGFPTSFRKAQDVLVAVKKMKSGGGWFSSANLRIRKAQEEVYLLERALRNEGFCSLPAMLSAVGKSGGSLDAKEAIFLFMNYFAQAFPNWRPEYQELNKFVPQLY
jgi:hypothetical protein